MKLIVNDPNSTLHSREFFVIDVEVATEVIDFFEACGCNWEYQN